MLYFAYGSNMLSRRLKHKSRVPSAEVVGVGFIEGHRLTFDKMSTDGSGKCDAEATGSHGDRVYGVIYEIPREEKSRLDRVERLGHGYAETTIDATVGSDRVTALMYYATSKDSSLSPYHWYKGYVEAGAHEHHLPGEYVAAIAEVQSIDDPDAARSAREKALLHDC